jgi:hypothetical protein
VRPARPPGRHGRPRRDTRDLRGRAPAHPPRTQPGGRRQARRRHPLVGALHGRLGSLDRQQPGSRQQGRGARRSTRSRSARSPRRARRRSTKWSATASG